MRKPGTGRKPNKTGRSKGAGQGHARFYRWEVDSLAFRSLSIGARALLIELKTLYNGNNNGALYLSVRTAAERLLCSKNRAHGLFAELQDRGFIQPKQVGGFNRKATRGGGTATTWILTEFPIGDAQGAGSKEFMSWRPTAENYSAVPLRGTAVPPEGTDPLKTTSTVPPGGTLCAKNGSQRSLSEGHSIVTMGGESPERQIKLRPADGDDHDGDDTVST